MTDSAASGPSAPAPLALACRGVRVAYGPRVVIPSFDLDVERGEMVVVLWPSGSGKSTLLAALAGFLPIEAGEIAIAGRPVAGRGRSEPPERRDVSVVFQSYALWPHLDALHTVAYPIRRRGIGSAAALDQARAILDRLGIGALATRRPAELSGGEQQRVGLGRALARGAGLYLLDEPTAHLDAALREDLQFEIADQRRQSGAGAILATHETTEALALADRVVLLRDGRVVQQGSPEAVYDQPADAWSARLTGPCSVLAVRLIEQSGGSARLEVGGATQVVVAGGGPGSLGPAEAIVRPEWLRLGGDVPARIERVAFRGSHTDYRLSTAAGEVVVRQLGTPEHAAGEAIGLTLDRAWLLAP